MPCYEGWRIRKTLYEYLPPKYQWHWLLQMLSASSADCRESTRVHRTRSTDDEATMDDFMSSSLSFMKYLYDLISDLEYPEVQLDTYS